MTGIGEIAIHWLYYPVKPSIDIKGFTTLDKLQSFVEYYVKLQITRNLFRKIFLVRILFT